MTKNNWLIKVNSWLELPGYRHGLFLFRKSAFRNVLYTLFGLFTLLLILDSMVLINLPVPVFIGWDIYVLAGFLVLIFYFKHEYTATLCVYLTLASFWWMGAVLNTGGIGSPIFFYAEVLLIFFALSGSFLINLLGTVIYLFVILTSFANSLASQIIVYDHLHEIPVHLLTIAIGFLLALAVRYYGQSYEEWQRKALTDHLTGLNNREGFIENGVWEEQKTGLFGLLDLNGFKHVNDTYGHQIGDQLLISVAKSLRIAFPAPIQWGRIGGDEFVFYFPNTPDVHLEEICEAIQSNIVDCSKELSVEISAAVGAIAVHKDCCTFHDLYKKSDEFMYERKQKRLQSVIYDQKGHNNGQGKRVASQHT